MIYDAQRARLQAPGAASGVALIPLLADCPGRGREKFQPSDIQQLTCKPARLGAIALIQLQNRRAANEESATYKRRSRLHSKIVL